MNQLLNYQINGRKGPTRLQLRAKNVTFGILNFSSLDFSERAFLSFLRDKRVTDSFTELILSWILYLKSDYAGGIQRNRNVSANVRRYQWRITWRCFPLHRRLLSNETVSRFVIDFPFFHVFESHLWFNIMKAFSALSAIANAHFMSSHKNYRRANRHQINHSRNRYYFLAPFP